MKMMIAGRDKKKYEQWAFLEKGKIFENCLDNIRPDPRPRLGLEPNSALPKIIWMYWHQGWDKAPRVCQVCKDSWRKFHPECQIYLLDQYNIHQYCSVPPYDCSTLLAGYSDRIRIELLRKYGGLWVDATVFCSGPIVKTIEFLNSHTNIFMISGRNTYGPYDSWLFSGTPQNAFYIALSEMIKLYFEELKARHHPKVHIYLWIQTLIEFILCHPNFRYYHDEMPQIHIGSPYFIFWRTMRCLSLNDYSSEDLAAARHQLGQFPFHKMSWREKDMSIIEHVLTMFEDYLDENGRDGFDLQQSSPRTINRAQTNQIVIMEVHKSSLQMNGHTHSTIPIA